MVQVGRALASDRGGGSSRIEALDTGALPTDVLDA
jgi:hypothetical protein